MRTAKCVVPLLIVALTGMAVVTATSGQDNAAQQPSNITADCLVKITVDPSVLPLNMETLRSLLHSSAVRGKAMTDVLGPGAAADRHEIIFIEWLSEAGQTLGAKMPRSSVEQGRDDAMMRQYEEIYGRDFAKVLRGQAEAPTGEGVAEGGHGMGGGMAMGGVSGGGTGGGMMGGMGGGGMSMGMSMGMGMGGMGGIYGGPASSETTQTVERSVVIKLTVALPDELRPLAKELLDALVVNLRNSLGDAHDKYTEGLKTLLTSAKSQRDTAEQNVQGAGAASSPETKRVREQLDKIVDLSVLSPEMPVSEAVEVLKNAVQPPLQIVALWNDLQEWANTEPSAPIRIDGMSFVRLGTALDLLLKGISDPLSDSSPVVYRIKDNVVVIGTSNALGMPSNSAAGVKIQPDIRALVAQKDELTRAIRSLELNQVSMEARRKAMYMQIEEARQQADKRLAADTVTQELEKLVQISTSHLELLQQRVTAGQMPQAELASAQESVARARIELARRREELSKLTGGGRIEQYDGELSTMAIDEAESRARLDVLRRQLADVQGQLTQASPFDPEAARIRVTQETLNLANQRVGELETRLATLQPPTVTIIGAN